MANVPYDLEMLIVRYLDSELTEEQELELNRELIRNPEARQLLADYRQTDELAVAALNQLVPHDVAPIPVTLQASVASSRRTGYYRAWWVLPGAVAAAVLALIIPKPSVGPKDNEAVQIAMEPASPRAGVIDSRQGNAKDVMRNVTTYPGGTRIKRSTGREVFGVVGDDGNVYWIQVDRIRTTRRPRRPTGGWTLDKAM